jgi:hypothetical protein
MYKYEELKNTLHTDTNQELLLQASEELKTLLSITGAVRKGVILRRICGDSWTAMAIVDRLVELNKNWMISKPHGESTAWQHEVISCHDQT